MKANLTLIGFLLLLFGFIYFILSLLGIKFIPFALLYKLSGLSQLLIQIAMMFGGVILMYVSMTAEEEKQQ
ncbi:MAG TPA: hypothetical protein P5235_09350 [Saprospiraceae bacterium]|nr:hypothetical protein [Lewinellaceae bacterium]HPK09731.1 hypothetical protein [Saprospiraceae bacterium]HRX29582.1 hypothetical protein [Saprospiraceae bacterium]